MRAVEAARGRGAQAGFTLLEVLISILLVSIGIFGFAKMQALALSDTHVASSRSVVALQAAAWPAPCKATVPTGRVPAPPRA